MENGDSNNVAALEKKSITAALKQDWKAAINTNLQLLDVEKKNKKSKMRLGRAYLQTRDFSKAEKLFKQVLREDPVNSIAKKNLELAKLKKAYKNHLETNPKNLIKEPGKTTTEMLELSSKKLTASSFSPREELGLKVNKASVNVLRGGKVIGKVIAPDLVRRLNCAKSKKASLKAEFHSGRYNVIRVLFKSDIAVFRSEKQELKPYMKKGTLDEPTAEMATTENTKS